MGFPISENKTDFNIYQPFFKKWTAGFEQKMVFSPDQIRFYHFYMPKEGAASEDFNCVPDGCVDVVFIYGEHERKLEFIGSPVGRNKSLITCAGSHYFGARLRPGVFFDLDEVSLADVTDHEIFFSDEALGAEAFFDELTKKKTLDEKIELFMAHFSPALSQSYLPQPVGEIIRAVNESKGRAAVSEIASELCYSERQVRRLMTDNMGFGPKTLSRIVRFQNAVHRLITKPQEDVLECISELGYSDQAHFQREFKEFTGTSPCEFKRSFRSQPSVFFKHASPYFNSK